MFLLNQLRNNFVVNNLISAKIINLLPIHKFMKKM